MKKNIIVSIDPGTKGGIVVFENELISEMYVIPVVKTKVDYRELGVLMNKVLANADFIIIEEVHSLFISSKKSNFSFGHINGFLLGLIISSGKPYTLVQPKQWQKDVWVNQDKIYIKKKIDTKSTSLLAAKRLFPYRTFLATKRSSVPHDGLIDAALIGWWWIINKNRNRKN